MLIYEDYKITIIQLKLLHSQAFCGRTIATIYGAPEGLITVNQMHTKWSLISFSEKWIILKAFLPLSNRFLYRESCC